MIVEGNCCKSEVKKKKGNVIGCSSEHGGSGKQAEHCACGGMRMVGFESARTIELKRFEFCRVRLWIKTYFTDGLDKDTAQVAIEEFILEMLKREEASVSPRSTEVYEPMISDDARDTLSRCVCRRIGVLYGLTLKNGKNEFESDGVDVIEELPISDGADIVAEFNKLSDEMAEKLNGHYTRIKDTNNAK
jgi:hypothetical protein